MNAILMLIIVFSAIDLALMAFYRILKIRRKNNSKRMIIEPGIKSKMLSTISELNKKLSIYEATMIDKKKHDELIRKYNILLNSHRELSRKNEALKSRLERLKQKIY